MVDFSQNFVAFSNYMNFAYRTCSWHVKPEKLRPHLKRLGSSIVDLTPPNVRTKLVATLNAYSCNKITKLRPEFKFPAKIEMAFSQILAISTWSNELQ